MVPLTTLDDGARALLVELDGERGFRRRLMELGLLPGTEIRLVRSIEVGGLVELEVRGGHVSLRSSEAKEILVEPWTEEG